MNRPIQHWDINGPILFTIRDTLPLTRLDVLSHVLPSLLSVCADGRHLGVLIIVDGESDAFTSVPLYIIHMYSYSAHTLVV